MLLAWRPTPARLGARLATSQEQRLTYAPVGMTTRPAPPSGYAVLEQGGVSGSGPAAWQRLADALLRWDVHREAGMVLAADAEQVRPGATVVNSAPFGPVSVLAPCRVVDVVDEPRRRGFTYGTLPGHPLLGEEQFSVELADDGQVHFRIRSCSRPRGAARVSPAATRAGQRLVNRRFVAAARRLAG